MVLFEIKLTYITNVIGHGQVTVATCLLFEEGENFVLLLITPLLRQKMKQIRHQNGLMSSN